MGGTRRQETGGEVTQGHEECGGAEGQPDSGCPQTQRAPPRNSEKGTDSPVDVQLNAKIMGMNVIAPSACSLGCPCARHSVSQHSLHTIRGARVEWKGRSRIYQCSRDSPSSAEPWTVLGPRVDQDGIFCLPHWVALNMGCLPTHPQAEDASQVLHEETGISSP